MGGLYPLPAQYKVTSAYGIKGENWTTCGFHTGCDMACPVGTPIYAPEDGDIRYRSYGSAFGDRAFALSPDAAHEWFFAHCETRLPDGTRVSRGQQIGTTGNRGNSTGPHLHLEYHTNKDWDCGTMRDPMDYLDAPGSGGGGGSGGNGPYVTEHVYSNKVGMGEPTNGDAESDTVKELRSRLDNISLVGGQTLGASPGVYDLEVDEEVRLWQEQVVHDTPDPPGQSYLGPNQFAAMFPSPPYTRHDVGLPSVAGGGGSSGGGDGTDGGGGTPAPPAAPDVMLPGAAWDPVSNFPGLRPFTGSAKKITLHTTETSVKPNWEQQQSGIPHLTVDLDTGDRWQHLDFGISAYTLNGGDFSPNSASGQNIQIEIIGFTRDCPSWSETAYGELADILHWLSDNLGIPYEFPLAFTSPARQGWSQWEPVSGVLGHCHAPYNSHTDPTGLRVDLLQPGTGNPPLDDEWVTRQELEAMAALLSQTARGVSSVLNTLADALDELWGS